MKCIIFFSKFQPRGLFLKFHEIHPRYSNKIYVCTIGVLLKYIFIETTPRIIMPLKTDYIKNLS